MDEPEVIAGAYFQGEAVELGVNLTYRNCVFDHCVLVRGVGVTIDDCYFVGNPAVHVQDCVAMSIRNCLCETTGSDE